MRFENHIQEPQGIFSTPHLSFYGGKVLTSPSFVSIYSGRYWQSEKGRSDRTYLDSFANSLSKSKYTSIWKEYGGGEGKFVGSTISTLAANKLTPEVQIQKIIESEIQNKTVPAPDGQTIYTVFLPPNSILSDASGTTSLEGMGGYHGGFISKNGKKAYYSALVYTTEGNGVPFSKKPLDNISIAASHEWSETITDPDVNMGKLGWYDRTFGEIGDIPINMKLPLKNAYGRINGFAVQKEWSNKKNESVIYE